MLKITKFFFLSLGLITFTLLTGCNNTMAGFGADMQQNGQKIENSAHDHDNN
jgi:predicted small secreted protein